jgi:hypothetical protein
LWHSTRTCWSAMPPDQHSEINTTRLTINDRSVATDRHRDNNTVKSTPSGQEGERERCAHPDRQTDSTCVRALGQSDEHERIGATSGHNRVVQLLHQPQAPQEHPHSLPPQTPRLRLRQPQLQHRIVRGVHVAAHTRDRRGLRALLWQRHLKRTITYNSK